MYAVSDEDYSRNFLTKSHIVSVAERLCRDCGLNNVSVKDICEASNVSRPTFYRHFKGKGDIACWIIARICMAQFETIGRGQTWEAAITQIARELSENATNLLNSATDMPNPQGRVHIQADGISRALTGIFKSRHIRITPLLRDQIDLYSLLFVTLFIEYATSERWSRLSPEELGRHASSFVPKELKAALLSS